MKSKALNFAWIKSECAVTQELTLNKDCTGVINNTSCDNTLLPGVTPIDWFLSSDSHIIHIRKLGEKTELALIKIVSIYDDELTLQGTFNSQAFFAIYKDVKQEP